MEKEISCGFLLFKETDEGRKYLLLKNHPENYWEFPKGHMEEGESYLETAYRELFEETQISKEDIEPVFSNEEIITESYEYVNDKGTPRLICLFAAASSKNPIISDEHCGFVWATLEEAKKLFPFEDEYEFLKKLVSKLSSITKE